MIHDISPPLAAELAVWPGDTPLTREVLCDLRRGDNLTLSTLRSTVHLGAHADAPAHYGVDAASIEHCALDRYLGTCEVVRVSVAPGRRVTPDLCPASFRAPRVLFATGTFPDCTRFNEDFAGLDPGLIDRLADAGVITVGVDTPSVDLFSDQELAAHQRCLARGIAILEGLVLAGIAPGLYDLVALPLKLVGFDASPVRAVLRDLPLR